MFAKLNLYKFQQTGPDHKETKLQKYLREQNVKLLEKCFNIKIEKAVAKNSKDSAKIQETNNEELSGQPNNREACQQTCENVSLVTEILLETASQQTAFKEINELDEPCVSEKPTAKNMQSIKSTRLLEHPNQKRSTTSGSLASSCNNYLKSNPSRTLTIQKKPAAACQNNWKSPFVSCTTKGTRTRLQRSLQSAPFSYDLSSDELKFVGPFGRPMRPTPEAERQLLKSGQRREYLMQRYEHTPMAKYHYPEATSWRIGWLQQKL